MPQSWQCEIEVYKATYHFIYAQKNFFSGNSSTKRKNHIAAYSWASPSSVITEGEFAHFDSEMNKTDRKPSFCGAVLAESVACLPLKQSPYVNNLLCCMSSPLCPVLNWNMRLKTTTKHPFFSVCWTHCPSVCLSRSDPRLGKWQRPRHLFLCALCLEVQDPVPPVWDDLGSQPAQLDWLFHKATGKWWGSFNARCTQL